MRWIMTGLMVAAFWGLPTFGVILNQLNPSYGNALGVAYAWFGGLILGVVLSLIVGVASVRWPILKFNAFVVAVAFLLLLAGFPLASSGALSRV